MESNRDIAGLLLMGGKGRRMEGQQKHTLLYDGLPFWLRSFKCLLALDRIYISVAQGQSVEESGLPLSLQEKIHIVADRYEDIGPIGGLTSALAGCREKALFVLPCDVPVMTGKLVEQMIARWNHERKNLILYYKGRPEPLIGIYNRDILPLLENQIRQGDYRVFAALQAVDHSPLDLESSGFSPSAIENINTPKDYERLIKGKKQWNE